MILLLAGCVSTRHAGKVYVTDGTQVALLPTKDMEGTVDAMHLLVVYLGRLCVCRQQHAFGDGHDHHGEHDRHALL